jgi:hypothetical protein
LGAVLCHLICQVNYLALPTLISLSLTDDYRIDVCGAQGAGLHAVWLKHHSVSRSWPEVQTSISIIHSLDELLDIERLVKIS